MQKFEIDIYHDKVFIKRFYFECADEDMAKGLARGQINQELELRTASVDGQIKLEEK